MQKKFTNSRLPPILQNLSIPMVAAPMFIASSPALVTSCITSGIVGSFPALNARPKEELDKWLTQIKTDADKFKQENPEAVIGPVAVNHIVNKSNDRLDHDLEVTIQHKVPIFITSLQAPPRKVVDAVHSYGGIILHDVISVRHAQKALEAGVDGLIAVAAYAGGHHGLYHPFPLVKELRKLLPNGPILLSGCISHGDQVLAAQVAGADLAYVGTKFLATPEANINDDYKQNIIESKMADIVDSKFFTGVRMTSLRKSIEKNTDLDPDNLPDGKMTKYGGTNAKEGLDTFSNQKNFKIWVDVQAAGMGVGSIDEVVPAKQVVAQFKKEYENAKKEMLEMLS